MDKPVIFCDFDGTVTKNDNIIHIMKHFAPPEWEGIKDEILAQTTPIEEGVARMFSLLPSSKREAITDFILSEAKIRVGFGEFVQYTRDQEIPLYIVSGGIDFFVYPILEPFGPFDNIYCNEADFSDENIRISFPHPCDDACTSKGCGCCKPAIIRELEQSDTTRIVIGDSITDLEAAKLADVVFARDFLLQKCQELGIAHYAFETFSDIQRILEEKRGGTA